MLIPNYLEAKLACFAFGLIEDRGDKCSRCWMYNSWYGRTGPNACLGTLRGAADEPALLSKLWKGPSRQRQSTCLPAWLASSLSCDLAPAHSQLPSKRLLRSELTRPLGSVAGTASDQARARLVAIGAVRRISKCLWYFLSEKTGSDGSRGRMPFSCISRLIRSDLTRCSLEPEPHVCVLTLATRRLSPDR
jgi:hypothetical protein